MKILNVNMSLDPVYGGGTAERTFQISRSLAGKGMQCAILTTDSGLTRQRMRDLQGIDIVSLPCLNKRFHIPRSSGGRVEAAVKDADILHLVNHWTLLNAIACILAKRYKKPYVVCPAGALSIYGRTKTLKLLFNRLIGKRIIHDADGHVATAINEIEQFESYGIDRSRVTLIPNGINTVEFEPRPENDFRIKFGIGSGPIILFMGRLNSIKGPDLLFRAFHNVMDKIGCCHLVFAGPEGGVCAQLQGEVRRLGLQGRVHFSGFISGPDKVNAYHAADLLVIPSRKEAMSIVVLEAGATATPVLITDQCGFNDVERIGGGKVVAASVSGLESGLTEVLGKPERLKTMGAKLKMYVTHHFTWDIAAAGYLKLYGEILDRKRAA